VSNPQAWDEDLHVKGAAWAPDGRVALLTWYETMQAPSVWLQLCDGTGNEIGRTAVDADPNWWCGRWIELPADAAAPQ